MMSSASLICIDARWIFPQISGIGRVTEKLITNLGQLSGPERYLLLFSNPQLYRFYQEYWSRYENLEPVLVPWDIYSWSGQALLPRYLTREKVDLFHSLNFFLPLLPSSIPMLSTIHDLIPLKFPEFTPRALKTKFNPVFRFILRRCAARSAKIITVSRHTASDLEKDLGIPPDKVEVIYNGIDSAYRRLGSKQVNASLPSELKPGGFFLYVGRFDPYKNVPGLVRAFDRFLKSSAANVSLVIVGHKDDRYPQAFETIERLSLTDRVTFIDGASEPELVALYNAALVLVLPSFYEGFGLPPLEAMACGTPVIVSKVSSLPEVVGDAGILIDPQQESSLVDALSRVWADQDLRRDLSVRGQVRAAKFSWSKAAEQTRALYRRVIEEAKR